jgi:glyoxylase-like metal-dependent hydrolase (beta-lactamase superfamily II)
MPALDYQDLLHGVTCIDTGYVRPGFAACYLIKEGNQAAFVDTGTAPSVPRLLEMLDATGIARENVAYVMPTHVHLDHAGGAGQLMRELPAAKLVVHPRGARHMIDPAKLSAGATSVYGEAVFRERFGELLPVPEERVIQANDGLILDLNGRSFLFVDTPGHARHHYSIYDETSKGIFTGDVFGLCYPQVRCVDRPFVFPTTTPVQFEPTVWKQSLDRLLDYNPQRIFLTHYGMLAGPIEKLTSDLCRRIDKLVEVARQAPEDETRHQGIVREMTLLLCNELAESKCAIARDKATRLFEQDLELNAQGLEVWLDRDL